jgi:cytochrome c-type biogenesis protein CcmE
VPGTIETKRQTLEYKFDVRRNGKTMPAYFRGATPDGFVADAEVVLTGRLGEDGTFVATAMSAKCPSKYEEAPLASTAR